MKKRSLFTPEALISFHLPFQRLCGSFGSRTNVKSSKNILLGIGIPSTVGPEVS